MNMLSDIKELALYVSISLVVVLILALVVYLVYKYLRGNKLHQEAHYSTRRTGPVRDTSKRGGASYTDREFHPTQQPVEMGKKETNQPSNYNSLNLRSGPFETQIAGYEMRLSKLESQYEDLSKATLKLISNLESFSKTLNESNKDINLRNECIEEYFKRVGSATEGFQRKWESIPRAQTKVPPASTVYQPKGNYDINVQEKRIQLNEKDLMLWWKECGHKYYTECKNALCELFLNVDVETILMGRDGEDWYLIGVVGTGIYNKSYYVLPRKYQGWWSDYIQRKSYFDLWYKLADENVEKSDIKIKGLIAPLPKAEKMLSGEWKLIGVKGKASIQEEP